MDVFKNPNCKKIRSSHILEVYCAHCKCLIANHQKVGESNFIMLQLMDIVSLLGINVNKFARIIICTTFDIKDII